MTSILAIDPGKTGAVVLYTNDTILIRDTPTIDTGGKGRDYDTAGMRLILEELACIANGTTYTLIESQQAMPGDGKSSAFVVGLGYGLWLGLLAGLQMPYERVAPARWKRATFGARSGLDKEASRLRACELFPSLADQLRRKKDHNRAEALLIAEFARRRLHGGGDGDSADQGYGGNR